MSSSKVETETAFTLLTTVCGVAVVAALRGLGWIKHSTVWAARGLSIALVACLISYTRTKRGGFAGSTASAFNWHPTLMVLAFFAFGVEASLVFRAPPLFGTSKRRQVQVHIGWSTLAVVFAISGLVVVLTSHSGGEVHAIGTTAPLHPELGHFPTAHSWIGLVTLILMFVQLAFGIFRHGSSSFAAATSDYHRFLGLLVLGTAGVTTALGLANFVDADQTRYIDGDRNLGVMTVLVWALGACVIAQHTLESGRNPDDDEQASLINSEN